MNFGKIRNRVNCLPRVNLKLLRHAPRNGKDKESDEWHVVHAKSLEEDKLIRAGFEFVRYDLREEVAIYRKRK